MSAAIPVSVMVRTVVVRSKTLSCRTAAFCAPIASASRADAVFGASAEVGAGHRGPLAAVRSAAQEVDRRAARVTELVGGEHEHLVLADGERGHTDREPEVGLPGLRERLAVERH